MIMPVFDAVSQATLEEGSCSKHASSWKMHVRHRSEVWMLSKTYDCIGDLITDLV